GQRLLRGGPGDLDEVGHRGTTTARRGRLVLADSHQLPPKMSMRSPSATLTMARLVLARLPTPKRVRRVLPWRFRVLTAVTFTLNTCSTAILISVLLASGRTRNVYLLASRRP